MTSHNITALNPNYKTALDKIKWHSISKAKFHGTNEIAFCWKCCGYEWGLKVYSKTACPKQKLIVKNRLYCIALGAVFVVTPGTFLILFTSSLL